MFRVSTRVAVAAQNESAARAALRIAEEGGGAVDAAVAAALVTMVTEPGIVSLAGGAYVSVWPTGAADACTVDGYVDMPGRGRPDLPVDAREVRTGYGGGVTMTVGPGSAAVPGALSALDLAQSQFGRLPWAEVVAPAEEVARGGFPLGSASGYYLPFVREGAFGWDPETVRALRRPDGGGWVGTGDRMLIDGLADTVRLIAEQGARTLYDGELAAVLVADMADRGGLVTAADLAAYRPVVRAGLPVRAGRWELRTNPPPSIGGPVLAAMLTLLGSRPAGAWTEGDVSALIAVQRRVLDARRESLDLAEDREAAALDLLHEVGWSGSRSPSTAHVSVADADGSACAITSSYGYGSGATVPGTGLWLNNCLGEHELNRGPRPEPGQRLPSNMAPTVGRRDDGAVLAIGSPGADRITTALLQVLASFAHGGVSLQDAVDRPRLHLQHLEDETGSVRLQLEAEDDLPLPATDLPVRLHHPHSMYFGGVGATLGLPSGQVAAAADPRRAGAALVSPET